ncbi:NAD-dependent epimerase/dehydratase family protein [Micromonospora sp. NPDC049559]|uniref:NAD-dependent epimerase/dehydratase family protein n=1 Tax=Micromonospora sp. NPDC049559 TaxID=3155923 RepID=UPI00343D23D1
MRIAITGATGNVGTALLRRLVSEPDIEVVGFARRVPGRDAGPPYEGVEWHAIDLGDPGRTDDLAGWFRGADAVVHLAWQVQPSRNRGRLRRTNVTGTRTVVRALQRAGVPKLVYASSFGAYSPGPKDQRVDENWPVNGVAASAYSVDKAAVEALLDGVEREAPELRVVRIRTGVVFQREAGAEISRYFLGRLLTPVSIFRSGRLPILPRNRRLRSQVVHADDAAEAYLLALRNDRVGAFNIAAEPVLDATMLARELKGHTVPAPLPLLRLVAKAAWHFRLVPGDPGWLDLTAEVPLMDCGRANRELGWQARRDARDAVREGVAGIAAGAGSGSPPMRPRRGAARHGRGDRPRERAA